MDEGREDYQPPPHTHTLTQLNCKIKVHNLSRISFFFLKKFYQRNYFSHARLSNAQIDLFVAFIKVIFFNFKTYFCVTFNF